MQNKDEAGDISSPTSSVDALFMVAAIAAKEKRHVMTMDIEGAYLHAPMTNDIVMELDPMLSDIMISLDKSYGPYVTDKGKLYVKLDKA
eukprot:5657838-Alexandrium_andersonii.AAC.1